MLSDVQHFAVTARRAAGFARRAAMLGLFLAVGACSTLQPTLPEPQPTGPIARSNPADIEDASLGAREHPRLISAFGGEYEDPKLDGVLARVVAKLIPASDRPDLRYQVTILNSPSVNAFALPGGYLYVTRGLLALANDESEVAAVLAHEMAHVTARHAAAREEQAKTAVLVNRVMTEVIRTGSDTDALASSQVSLAGFSRRQEIEADAIGMATISRAGYDANAAVEFLVSMGRQAAIDAVQVEDGTSSQDPTFLASHPSTPQRIEQARALAQSISGRSDVTAGGRGEYLAAIDGMLYGDTSLEGFARGRRFLHAELGFTFDAPRGFVLENSSQAVFGVGSNGEALRFDGATVAGNGPPVELVANGWIEGAAVREVRPIIVDGLPGATGLASAGEWTFRLGAIRRGDTVYRFVLGSKGFNPETDRAFLDTIRSFRRLSPDEVGQAAPLRIRTVAVGSTDTISSMARRMAFDDRQLERFLALNGLNAGDVLQPGTQLKIIAE